MSEPSHRPSRAPTLDAEAAGLSSRASAISVAVETSDVDGAAHARATEPIAAELAWLADRYEVIRRIGAGGMGVVYEARDRALDRPIALKVLRAHGAITGDQIERLEREARTAARLGHPNIVAVTDFGHVPGRGAYLVMELLSGESLAARLTRKRSLSPAEVIDVALQVLDALAAAHRAGVVHRDLKPENIHLVPLANGTRLAKLLDFGIVKLRESPASKQLTERGAIIGTPIYMAPEQVDMREVDARTDVYAMGATMYQMLSGMMPYDARTPAAIVGAILDGPPVPLSIRAPELPPKLLAIVERAMSREPDARFADAGVMRDALIATDARLGATMIHGGQVAPPPPAPHAEVSEAAETRAARPSPLRSNASEAVTAAVLPRQRMAPIKTPGASATTTSGSMAIQNSSLDARLVAIVALIAVLVLCAAVFVWARTSGLLGPDATPPASPPIALTAPPSPAPPSPAPPSPAPPSPAPPSTASSLAIAPPDTATLAPPSPAPAVLQTPVTEPRVRRVRPTTSATTMTTEGPTEPPPPGHRVDEFIDPFAER